MLRTLKPGSHFENHLIFNYQHPVHLQKVPRREAMYASANGVAFFAYAKFNIPFSILTVGSIDRFEDIKSGSSFRETVYFTFYIVSWPCGGNCEISFCFLIKVKDADDEDVYSDDNYTDESNKERDGDCRAFSDKAGNVKYNKI